MKIYNTVKGLDWEDRAALKAAKREMKSVSTAQLYFTISRFSVDASNASDAGRSYQKTVAFCEEELSRRAQAEARKLMWIGGAIALISSIIGGIVGAIVSICG
ncbi:hypothetical protein ACXN5S_12460 [Pseudoroseicyclus sp. H15]